MYGEIVAYSLEVAVVFRVCFLCGNKRESNSVDLNPIFSRVLFGHVMVFREMTVCKQRNKEEKKNDFPMTMQTDKRNE